MNYTADEGDEYKERIMPISSIDTHKFVRRLEQAGMPVELAGL